MQPQEVRRARRPRAEGGTAHTPRALALQAEITAQLPEGSDERFSGWGVMGLPFRSGDVLAMRRFPLSSLGAGYTSVWHRDPQGAWTIWSDRPALESCARYFGGAIARAVTTAISLQWSGPRRFGVRVPAAGLAWDVQLTSTTVTRALNVVARGMPDAAWRNVAVLAAMAHVAGPMLHAGHLGLAGHAPNGQEFIANPMQIWVVESSTATLGGRDLGEPGPLEKQTRLGDFWIPQRGLVAMGRAFFEPADPARHRLVTAIGAEPGA